MTVSEERKKSGRGGEKCAGVSGNSDGGEKELM